MTSGRKLERMNERDAIEKGLEVVTLLHLKKGSVSFPDRAYEPGVGRREIEEGIQELVKEFCASMTRAVGYDFVFEEPEKDKVDPGCPSFGRVAYPVYRVNFTAQVFLERPESSAEESQSNNF